MENGKSPAEMLFGRQIRSTVPCISSNLTPKWPGLEKMKEEELERKVKQKVNFDLHHNAKELSVLEPGQHVWVKDKKIPATVQSKAETPRSYLLETPKGNTIRRNRIALAPFNSEQPSSSGEMPADRPTAPTVENSLRTRSGRAVVPPKRLDL